MVALTALLIPISLLASADLEKPKSFTFWMLMLEASVIGVFLALDAIVFFVFFELVLVPMYFLIAGWGHGNRRYAAVKFFLYTMAGFGVPLRRDPVGRVPAPARHRPPHVRACRCSPRGRRRRTRCHGGTAKWLFVAFAIGFAVKIPLIPFHTWLPDAHTDAPTAGSVVLAGVLLKMGTYGFLRFAIPMFPQAAVDLAPILLVLAVIGITYGAIVAAMQPNLKRIIAYSSVAHLGFVVLGVFAFTSQGISGGLFTMLSHGLTTGALFLLVGMLYDRRHTYELSEFRGLWKAVPVLRRAVRRRDVRVDRAARLLRDSSASSCRCSARSSRAAGTSVVATTGVILAAVYLLWAVQRAFTGEPDEKNVATTRDRLPRALHGRAAARPVAVPRLLPQARARPAPAERRRARHARSTPDSDHKPRRRCRRRPCTSERRPHVCTRPRRRASDRRAPARAPIAAPSIDWFAIAPEIALFAAALIIVLLRSLVRHDPRVHEPRC